LNQRDPKAGFTLKYPLEDKDSFAEIKKRLKGPLKLRKNRPK
jgi:hypothetical protein